MRRDWTHARAKVDSERRCRVCGDTVGIEAAHTIGRKHDSIHPLSSTRVAVVQADDIVPLCQAHHTAYDRHELDLLPYLSHVEQAAAVAHVEIVSATRRLTSTR